jgi:hypothetical protein
MDAQREGTQAHETGFACFTSLFVGNFGVEVYIKTEDYTCIPAKENKSAI